MKFILFSTSIVLLSLFAYVSLAEDISVFASVDRKEVSVGDAITLTIHIQGSQAVNPPDLPEIEGFQSRYMGARRQISVVNNHSSVSMAHNYLLWSQKAGRFTIPPISVEYGGKTYRTDSIAVQAVPGVSDRRKLAMTTEELQRYIRLDISTKRKIAYLNEGVPLLIRLYIRSGVDVRDVQYPTFPSAGFSVLPFGEPIQKQATVEGILFRTIDFPATVYPVASGELVLGPAELNCNLMVTASSSRDTFFDQRMRYGLTIKSEPYAITVKSPPEAGKPEGFSGAVGQYELSVAAKPTSLRVGEPITLTMIVKGQGNIDVANIPKVADLTEFKVYDPQINVKKEGNLGEKTFEQVLIPKSASVTAIPEIQFSYFDPESESYKTKTKGPITIQVLPSDTAEPLQILEITGGKAVKREVLGKDIVYIKDEIGSVNRGDARLYADKVFLLLQLVPLLGFAGVLVYQRRRNRFATDRIYARQYHAPRKANKGLAQARKLMESGQTQEFCSTVFKTMQVYLGDRFDLPYAGITIEVLDSLQAQGIPEEILEKLSAFFQACDRTRFAGADASNNEMSNILELATESIRLLENSKV